MKENTRGPKLRESKVAKTGTVRSAAHKLVRAMMALCQSWKKLEGKASATAILPMVYRRSVPTISRKMTTSPKAACIAEMMMSWLAKATARSEGSCSSCVARAGRSARSRGNSVSVLRRAESFASRRRSMQKAPTAQVQKLQKTFECRVAETKAPVSEVLLQLLPRNPKP